MVTLVWWLVANAVVVAALMPIVWLVCRLVRFRPAIQHLLWFLLFMKLIAPPVLDWPWRANDLIPDAIVREPLTTERTDVTVGPVSGDVSRIAAGVAPIETDAVTELPAAPTTVALPSPALSLGEIAVIAWAAGAASASGLHRLRRMASTKNCPQFRPSARTPFGCNRPCRQETRTSSA